MGVLNIKALTGYAKTLKTETQTKIVKKIKSGCASCNKKKGEN